MGNTVSNSIQEDVYAGQGRDLRRQHIKAENPEKFARSIVQATTHYQDYELIARVSKEIGTPMKGIEIRNLAIGERMQERGW